jgi:hypothetical protein
VLQAEKDETDFRLNYIANRKGKRPGRIGTIAGFWDIKFPIAHSANTSGPHLPSSSIRDEL